MKDNLVGSLKKKNSTERVYMIYEDFIEIVKKVKKKKRLFRGDGGLKIPSTPVFIRLSDI